MSIILGYVFPLSKYVNVRYRNNYVLLLFYQEKLTTKFNKVSLRGLLELEILENFTTAFLLKTIIWTLIFFQVLQSAPLKDEKKFSQKDVSHLKMAWHSKRRYKNIQKSERKTKNEKKSKNNNTYFV